MARTRHYDGPPVIIGQAHYATYWPARWNRLTRRKQRRGLRATLRRLASALKGGAL